jgi:hypothetical protein
VYVFRRRVARPAAGVATATRFPPEMRVDARFHPLLY